jgi:hypothetical protein
MRAILRDALALAGHELMEAVDGHEGLLHVQRHPPDLAIEDLFLQPTISLKMHYGTRK